MSMVRRSIFILGVVSILLGSVSQTYAQTITPSTTRTPTPSRTPTSTISSLPTTCDELTIVSGNEGYPPASVTFSIKATNALGTTSKYRFYFGDTQTSDTNNTTVTHSYASSGPFTAVVQVKDASGNWKGSTLCIKTVTIKPLPVVQNMEAKRSECSNVILMQGNNTQAPTTAQFLVTGFDNKGAISKYKIDFGDGTQEEKPISTFEKLYTKAGTYVIKGYITDSANTVKGGTQGCSVSLTINTTNAMTQQPSTGTPTWFTAAAIGSGVLSLLLFKIKKLYKQV